MVYPWYPDTESGPGILLVISTLKHHFPAWGATVLVPKDSGCQKSTVSTFSNTGGVVVIGGVEVTAGVMVVEAGTVGTDDGVFSAEPQLEPAHKKMVNIKEQTIALIFIF
jgi:hypothetical protein